MNKGFVRGAVIGGLIGASMSMVMNSDMMHGRARRSMMRKGRRFVRRSGEFIGGMMDVFR